MSALRVVSRARYLSVPLRNLSSNISGGSMGRAWADKEHAAESQYFNKKDAELLNELAAKLHKHTAPDDSALASAKEQILAICQKHSVPTNDAFVDEIVKFKFNH